MPDKHLFLDIMIYIAIDYYCIAIPLLNMKKMLSF